MMIAFLAGCSGSGDPTEPGPELPAGTELGDWGSTLKIDDSIQLVLGDQAGGTSGSVVRLQVVEVRKGDPADLDTFTGVPAQSTPWYVSVAEHHRGPADVNVNDENGCFLRLGSDLEVPPTGVNGQITAGPTTNSDATLPVARGRLNCLLFLVPNADQPASVDYLRNNGIETVSWRIPSNIGTGS